MVWVVICGILGAWPQWGLNPQQTAKSTAPLPSISLHEWTFKPSPMDRVVASPVTDEGFIWVASDNGRLYKLNQTDGTVAFTWSSPIASSWPACALCHPKCKCATLRSTPAVDIDGGVIFGAYDYFIYKVDAQGKTVWRVETGGAVYGPVTLDKGVAFVGSFDGFLYAIESRTGHVHWRFNMESHGDCGPAIGSGIYSDILVTASNEGGLCDAMNECFVFAINKTTGRELWRVKTGKAGISGGGTIARDTYFSGSWNRKVAAYDLRTGAVRWSVDVAGEVEARPAFDADTNTVFFSTEESHSVVALCAKTGKVRWNYTDFGQEVNGSPSLAAGLVYVGANDGYLRALNSSTGEVRFKFKTCAFVFSSAAIADNGMVYIGCNTGTSDRRPGVGALYALNPTKHLKEE